LCLSNPQLGSAKMNVVITMNLNRSTICSWSRQMPRSNRLPQHTRTRCALAMLSVHHRAGCSGSRHANHAAGWRACEGTGRAMLSSTFLQSVSELLLVLSAKLPWCTRTIGAHSLHQKPSCGGFRFAPDDIWRLSGRESLLGYQAHLVKQAVLFGRRRVDADGVQILLQRHRGPVVTRQPALCTTVSTFHPHQPHSFARMSRHTQACDNKRPRSQPAYHLLSRAVAPLW
jgi:hypothetical protein